MLLNDEPIADVGVDVWCRSCRSVAVAVTARCSISGRSPPWLLELPYSFTPQNAFMRVNAKPVPLSFDPTRRRFTAPVAASSGPSLDIKLTFTCPLLEEPRRNRFFCLVPRGNPTPQLHCTNENFPGRWDLTPTSGKGYDMLLSVTTERKPAHSLSLARYAAVMIVSIAVFVWILVRMSGIFQRATSAAQSTEL
jgi:hypothetical protein